MENRTRTERQVSDWNAGQIAALGIAVQAILKHHPLRDQVAQAIHDSMEQMLSRALASNWPDETVKGMQSVRDVYLLREQADPGQPTRP
jgi:hypothetical protein